MIEDDVGIWEHRRRAKKERRSRKISGNIRFDGMEFLIAVDGDRAVLLFDVCAKGSQSEFRVIARRNFFDDGRATSSTKASQEDAALHLRTCDGHVIGDRFEPSAVDDQWRTITV